MTPLPGASFPAHKLFEAFQQAGLTRARVRQLTRGKDNLRSPLTPTREGELSDERAAVLLRVFFCGVSEDLTTLSNALSLTPQCIDFNLLVLEGNRVRSPLHLRYVRQLLLFSDYLGSGSEEVMGAGETTAILYGAARPTHRIGRALDLGCGAGTLALLLAADADFVLGTDINERAVQMSRLNAALNAIDNVEFRTGDTFEPVENQRFDLIVSQPPYYPHTGTDLQTYLHGGPQGDEIARRMSAEMPIHLTPTGRGLLFASWPQGRIPHHRPNLRIVELNTNRREAHGTRQSLQVIEHAEADKGWTVSLDVPADCWDQLSKSNIDQAFAAEQLAQGPDEDLRTANLSLPEGLKLSEEDGQTYAVAIPRTMVGVTPISVDIAAALANPKQANLTSVREALRRWLLVPQSSPEGPAS